MTPRKMKGTRSCDFPDGPQGEALGKDGTDATFPEEAPREQRRGRKGTKRASNLIDAPMAVTSAGDVIISITHLEDTTDVSALVARLIDEGHTLFIGVAVPDRLRRELRKDVEDAGAEIVARLGPRLRTVRSRR